MLNSVPCFLLWNSRQESEWVQSEIAQALGLRKKAIALVIKSIFEHPPL